MMVSLADVTHVDYPHTPGYLYDCAACESSCHCDTEAVAAGRQTPCVYCEDESEALAEMFASSEPTPTDC